MLKNTRKKKNQKVKNRKVKIYDFFKITGNFVKIAFDFLFSSSFFQKESIIFEKTMKKM
ncbi:MAG: hypothetical protein IJ181_01650 [Acidaminococcaceae bacterium]|nr:hypothetical protein [Acidaminococcaceae bacterium]